MHRLLYYICISNQDKDKYQKTKIMQAPTIAIHESKTSDKVIRFATGVYELMAYCSKRQAIKICNAAENGLLYGAYFTKSGNVRATYIA